VEFRGRKGALAANAVMAAIFTAALAFCIYCPFAFPRSPAFGISMGAILGACVIGLLTVAGQNILAGLSTIRLSDKGVEIAGPLRTVSLSWTDIESAADVSRNESRSLGLGLRGGGKLLLRIHLIEDGDELARLVRERWSAVIAPPDRQAKLYRRENEAVVLFSLAMIDAMSAVVIYWSLQAPGGIRKAAELWLAVPLLLYVTARYIAELGSFVQVTASEFIIGNRWGRHSYPLRQIERVDVRSNTVRMWVGGRPVRIPSGLTDMAELRARLAPDAESERLAPTYSAFPSAPPIPEMGALTYRQPARSRIGMVLMTVLCLAFAVGTVVAGLNDPHGGFLIALGLLVWGGMFVLGLYVTLLYSSEFTVDGYAFARKSPLGSWRLEWSHVDQIWRRGSGMTEYRLVSNGVTYNADITKVADAERLAGQLNSRLTESAHPWAREPGHVFRSSTERGMIGVLLLLLPFGIGAAWFTYAPPPGAPRDWSLAGVFGALLLLIGGIALAVIRRYETAVDGLWVRGPFLRRFIPFAEVTRVTFGRRHLNKSNSDLQVMTIEHPAGGITITSQVDDYTLLVAYVLWHVRSKLVRDEFGG
jgi:hypothetical protein